MTSPRNDTQAGFTLIELMITVTILAIIVAVGYSNYQSYVFDTRRTDGHSALMNAAQRLERCFASSMEYNSGACAAVDSAIEGSTSPEGHYALATSDMGATSYTLTATPQDAQDSDKCGNLTLDHTGATGIAGADSGVTEDDCW